VARATDVSSGVLQELCPRCGNEYFDEKLPCSACGWQPVEPASVGALGSRFANRVLLGIAAAAIVAVIAGSGFQAPPPSADLRSPPSAGGAQRSDLPIAPPRLGRVVFAERVAASTELQWHQTQFSAGDTIAWRAEFVEPPRAAELTVVIAWQSHRERMELSRATVALGAPELIGVLRDAVPVDELVPTAGMYAVSYFAGDEKLAEGVFEVLPPDR
jgi:hypothetical protein